MLCLVVLSNTPRRAEVTMSSSRGTLLTFHDTSNQWYKCSAEPIGEGVWLTARHCAEKVRGGMYIEENGSTIIQYGVRYLSVEDGASPAERIHRDIAVIGDPEGVRLELGDLLASAKRGENGLIVVRAWQKDGAWHECRTRLRNAEYINGNWYIQCGLKPGASGAVVWYTRDAKTYIEKRDAEKNNAATSAEVLGGGTSETSEAWLLPGMVAVGVVSSSSTTGWNSIADVHEIAHLLGPLTQ